MGVTAFGSMRFAVQQDCPVESLTLHRWRRFAIQLGSALAARDVAALAQQGERMRRTRIGVMDARFSALA
jgi:hypothetical protein